MTNCQHDYDNPIRKWRAHYVCPKCAKDITLELVLIYELEHDNPLDTQHDKNN